MVSMPDDLLHAVDAEAQRRGTTRSGLLRTFADEALGDRDAIRAARVRELYEGVELTGHGGNSAEVVKQMRPKH